MYVSIYYVCSCYYYFINQRLSHSKIVLNNYAAYLNNAVLISLLFLQFLPISCSVIREIKRVGGLDTVGVEYGDGIIKKVRAELAAICGQKRADELMKTSLEVNDAISPWWTPLSSYETESEQQERIKEFLNFVRYSEAQLPIFVGHSLFFRAFYSKRISKLLYRNRPALSANMRRFRLSNAAMMAVTVEFFDENGGDAIILDADLIYGGGFHGVPQNKAGTTSADTVKQIIGTIYGGEEYSNNFSSVSDVDVIVDADSYDYMTELNDTKNESNSTNEQSKVGTTNRKSTQSSGNKSNHVIEQVREGIKTNAMLARGAKAFSDFWNK